ncbi:MAG TPA: serine hydrolase domain-containing protein [Candidatus Krumholzibacteria bacterium]|nr:serine hydrolase domain-containing protein [Candidatus Krumholzibacteria bacterium]
MVVRRALSFAAISALALCVSAHAGNIVAADGKPFDEYLLYQEAYGFSGAVLVARGDHIALAKGYGFADRSRNARFEDRTRINIGSLSKAYTATIILRLEQDGLVHTSDKLGDLLPGVPDDKKSITVEQLLTHTAGLAWDSVPRGKKLTRDDVLAKILAAKLRSQPGERFAYSNAGYELLAAIAETRSGRSFDALVQQYIAKPAHAQNTTIVGGTGDAGNVAHSYNEWKDLGTWREWNDGWHSGSGDVISTLIDVWKWHRALRAGTIIQPEAAQRMFAAHVKSDDGGGYGYGWFTQHTDRGDSLVYHGGDNRGYHTELRWYVNRDLTIIVFTNLDLYDESGSGLGLHKRIIANALEKIDRGENVPLPPRPTATGANAEYLASFTKSPSMEGATVERGPTQLVFNADSQEAINRILDLHDERLEKDNVKVATLLDATARRDSSLVRKTLDKANADFFLAFAFAEREELEKRLGKFKSARVCGSKPLPWDDSLVRTFALLTFEKQTVDYQFTWKRDAFYETISETGALHALTLPMMLVDREKNEFVVWDLVGRRGAQLTYERAGESVRLVEVAPFATISR